MFLLLYIVAVPKDRYLWSMDCCCEINAKTQLIHTYPHAHERTNARTHTNILINHNFYVRMSQVTLAKRINKQDFLGG